MSITINETDVTITVASPTATTLTATTQTVDITTVNEQGIAGAQGERGLQGIQGIKGDTGTAGADGQDGKEIEISKNSTHIQWRYVGESWTNLVAIADLKGDAGNAGANGTNGSDGADGSDGKELEIQVTATHIQTRLAGGSWSNLIALSSLRGADGANGTDGADAQIAGTIAVDLDFGSGDGFVSQTVTGVNWVTTSQTFLKNAADSTDHTIEETAIEGVSIQIANVVNGVGFDIYGYAPFGTHGTHRFNISGI